MSAPPTIASSGDSDSSSSSVIDLASLHADTTSLLAVEFTPQALTSWKEDWTRINALRRARMGRPPLATTTMLAADELSQSPPVHGTRASMRHATGAAAAIPSSPTRSQAISAPQPQAQTSSPLRAAAGVPSDLFSSATYFSSSPSSVAAYPPSSPHIAAASSIAGSPRTLGHGLNAQMQASPPRRYHGSRMHAAALAAATSKTSAASSPSNSPAASPLKRNNREGSPPPTALASSSSAAPISVYQGVSMVALKPTVAAAATSGDAGESSAKRPKLSSASSGIAPERTHLLAPFCSSPPPLPMASPSRPRGSPPKPGAGLFASAPRRKSSKLVGAHTPGLHNSSGIHSFTLGVDTPEDRAKRDWMVNEFEEWRAAKQARQSAEAKRPNKRTHTDMAATDANTPHASPSQPTAAASAGPSPSAAPVAAALPIDLTCVTPPRSTVASASAQRHPHTSYSRHTGSGGSGGSGSGNERVRRSLFDELSRTATPNRSKLTAMATSPLMQPKGTSAYSAALAASLATAPPAAAAVTSTQASFSFVTPTPAPAAPTSAPVTNLAPIFARAAAKSTTLPRVPAVFTTVAPPSTVPVSLTVAKAKKPVAAAVAPSSTGGGGGGGLASFGFAARKILAAPAAALKSLLAKPSFAPLGLSNAPSPFMPLGAAASSPAPATIAAATAAAAVESDGEMSDGDDQLVLVS